MSCLAVIEKLVEEENVQCPVLPHPNIAFKKPQGTYEQRDTERDTLRSENTMTARIVEDFKDYYTSILEPETFRIILLQIAHAVYHFHEQGWYYGKIEIDQLRITKCKKKVVLLQSSTDYSKIEKDFEKSKKGWPKDRKQFGSLIEELLKRNSKEKGKKFNDNIVEHLLKKLTKASDFTSYFTPDEIKILKKHKLDKKIKDKISDDFTFKEVLQHPYFWSTGTKLRFLSITGQRCKEKNGDRAFYRGCLKYSKGVFNASKGWIAELEITDESELDRCNKVLREKNGGKDKNSNEKVMSNTISKLAKRKRPVYDAEHLWSLLVFIRDRLEHYWAKEKQIQACFLFDPLEEFWRFFNDRFPNILPVVYDVIKDAQLKYGDKDYKSYFDKMAPNRDLPVVRKNEQPTADKGPGPKEPIGELPGEF